MVEPSFADRSVINHNKYLTNGRIVTSPAVNITDTDVMTANGLVIGYDYLVIATGHNDLLPKTRNEKLLQYRAEYDKMESSDSILIVGGGPSGVELTAEIAVDFPKKKVTLVHDGPRLLEFAGNTTTKQILPGLVTYTIESRDKGCEEAIHKTYTFSPTQADGFVIAFRRNWLQRHGKSQPEWFGLAP